MHPACRRPASSLPKRSPAVAPGSPSWWSREVSRTRDRSFLTEWGSRPAKPIPDADRRALPHPLISRTAGGRDPHSESHGVFSAVIRRSRAGLSAAPERARIAGLARQSAREDVFIPADSRRAAACGLLSAEPGSATTALQPTQEAKPPRPYVRAVAGVRGRPRGATLSEHEARSCFGQPRMRRSS
jgi:hypothetical protein